MAKILFVADLHIKLGQKNVPRQWQYDRFMLLADEINKIPHDYVVIGGDLLDVANPSISEIGLMYDFLDRIVTAGLIIPGNHEMVSKTKDCFVYIDSMLEDLNFTIIRDFYSADGIDYIPYNILHRKTWGEPKNPIAITHVRGEIPPHVLPEIDLERFNAYTTVFAGDLHSYKNSQANLVYPGSPFATSFHRNIPSGSNGVIMIDTGSGEYEWIELNLPQLVRTKLTDPELMVATDFHHTIYELEGDLEDLAKVKNSELLDKKITKDISTPPTLNLSGDLAEELGVFLKEIKGLDNVEDFVTLFKDVYNDSN